MPPQRPTTMSVVASHRRTLTKRGMAARTAGDGRGISNQKSHFNLQITPSANQTGTEDVRCGLIWNDLRALPPAKTRPATPERGKDGMPDQTTE